MGVKKGNSIVRWIRMRLIFFLFTYHLRAFFTDASQPDLNSNVAKHFIKHLVHANCICIISYQLACEIVRISERNRESVGKRERTRGKTMSHIFHTLCSFQLLLQHLQSGCVRDIAHLDAFSPYPCPLCSSHIKVLLCVQRAFIRRKLFI